jgi:hypothetical protein
VAAETSPGARRSRRFNVAMPETAETSCRPHFLHGYSFSETALGEIPEGFEGNGFVIFRGAGPWKDRDYGASKMR